MNPNLCHSVKNQTPSGRQQQCPCAPKPGTNFCGRHQAAKILFIVQTDNNLPKSGNAQVIQSAEPIPQPEITPTQDSTNQIQTRDWSKYQNDTDFYTLESIKTIADEYFCELEENGKYFAFDIRSFVDYFKQCNPYLGYKNPYTNEKIPAERVREIARKYKQFQRDGHDLTEYAKTDIVITPEQELRNRAVRIFQRINELGNYADFEWFMNLSMQQLKRFYVALEDIWNYRLQLTIHAKFNVIGTNDPFREIPMNVFMRVNQLFKLRNLMLDIIEAFITRGIPAGKIGTDNYITGSIYVLTALVEVSRPAALALPHLVNEGL